MKGLASSFTSVSVNDLEVARDFYTRILELKSLDEGEEGMLMLDCGRATRCMVYEKDDHEASTYTVLNFEVADIGDTADELAQKGVVFEPLEGTDDKGIATMGSIKMAWFKDPAGNWLSLIANN